MRRWILLLVYYISSFHSKLKSVMTELFHKDPPIFDVTEAVSCRWYGLSRPVELETKRTMDNQYGPTEVVLKTYGM